MPDTGLRRGGKSRPDSQPPSGLSSRRGDVTIPVRRSTNTQQGSVFIPFHYREAAANVLTTDKLDPDGKIPEFKFCAVKLGLCTEDRSA